MIESNIGTCFFYHRNDSWNVTIAYLRDGDAVHYGASFCRPEDQFEKRMGRKIASGRLALSAGSVMAATFVGDKAMRWEVHEAILESLERRDYDYIPQNFTWKPEWKELCEGYDGDQA